MPAALNVHASPSRGRFDQFSVFPATGMGNPVRPRQQAIAIAAAGAEPAFIAVAIADRFD